MYCECVGGSGQVSPVPARVQVTANKNDEPEVNSQARPAQGEIDSSQDRERGVRITSSKHGAQSHGSHIKTAEDLDEERLYT